MLKSNIVSAHMGWFDPYPRLYDRFNQSVYALISRKIVLTIMIFSHDAFSVIYQCNLFGIYLSRHFFKVQGVRNFSEVITYFDSYTGRNIFKSVKSIPPAKITHL